MTAAGPKACEVVLVGADCAALMIQRARAVNLGVDVGGSGQCAVVTECSGHVVVVVVRGHDPLHRQTERPLTGHVVEIVVVNGLEVLWHVVERLLVNRRICSPGVGVERSAAVVTVPREWTTKVRVPHAQECVRRMQ